MNEPKYCPMLMIARGGAISACLCMKEHCAWYVRYYTGEGNCALKDIATSLPEIERK